MKFDIDGDSVDASVKQRLRARLAKAQSRLPLLKHRSYREWAQLYDTISPTDRDMIGKHLAALSHAPLISVVMPVYNTPDALLREAFDCVRAQLYPNWELCVADDASTLPTVQSTLQNYAALDSRIKITRRETNGNISLASNSALELSSGEFVALMDHDDILPEHALYEVVALLNEHPDADVIYSDEDKVSDDGKRMLPYFKTDWNPELFLGHNMISHLGVYRRTLLEMIGGFRHGFEGSQDYDLALRATAATTAARIHHIPAVLYHWRQSKGARSFSESQLDRCIAAARRAKRDFLAARKERAVVVQNPSIPFWEEIRRTVPDPAPLVTIVVLAKNQAKPLKRCVDGLLNRTNYPNFEIIIIDGNSPDAKMRALLDLYRRDDRVQIIPYEGEFNYSDMNNKAVASARGDIIALVSSDIDIKEPDWLAEMVSLAALPENGVVGGKLLHPNGRIQHGGVILGLRGVVGHAFANTKGHEKGYFGRLVMASNISAVTAACLVVRKSVFEEVGGLNAIDLAAALSDVDLCLKAMSKGYRNVWTPRALFLYHESNSADQAASGQAPARFDRENAYMRRVWGELLDNDPYFNPNLSLRSHDYDLAFPPRRVKPWVRFAADSKLELRSPDDATT